MLNYGSYTPTETVRMFYTKSTGAGARSAWSATLEEADLKVFKDGSVMTLSASTIAFSHDASSSTGLDIVTVDMNNDADFTWGSRYVAVLYPSDETVGGTAPIGIVGLWDTMAIPTLTGTFSGTHTSTTSDLGTNAPANDIKGMTLYAPLDKLSVVVTSYNTSTGVATHDAWATGAGVTNAEPWILFPTANGSANLPQPANVEQINGATITGDGDGTPFDVA
jgi:hypothetical protein